MRRHLGIVLVYAASIIPLGDAVAGLKDVLPPAAYIDPVDRQIARTGKGTTARPFPCSKAKVDHGIDIVEDVPTDRRVRMQPSKRWRGLWLNDFEGSQFCPAPATDCSFNSKGDRIWLTSGPLRGKRGAVYSVQFIGRRTLYKGPYGHMGVSDHEIIVDQVISAKMVKAPPPPMTKAQLIAYWKRCEAEGTCFPSKEMRAMMNGAK